MSDLQSSVTAVILAGGLGTRLRPAVADRPKVLAPVLGRPFLAILLDQLAGAGISKAVVCTGHMAESVEACMGTRYKTLSLSYSREHRPMGTGGALRLALAQVKTSHLLVMNGDSYTHTRLADYLAWFRAKAQRTALMVVRVPDAGRFGRVVLDQTMRIVSFDEKKPGCGAGWINAGLYLISREGAGAIPVDTDFSLEKDFFPGLVRGKLHGYRAGGPFIDIGTPAAYRMAEGFFRNLPVRLNPAAGPLGPDRFGFQPFPDFRDGTPVPHGTASGPGGNGGNL